MVPHCCLHGPMTNIKTVYRRAIEYQPTIDTSLLCSTICTLYLDREIEVGKQVDTINKCKEGRKKLKQQQQQKCIGLTCPKRTV